MNQEDFIKKLMEQVMQSLGDDAPEFQKKEAAPSSVSSATSSSAPASNGARVTAADYPLGDKIPERIKSATGRVLADFTIERVLNGELKPEDFRIAPETLELQAQVAESVNRPHLASNMRRASELVKVPDDELLAAYDSLRPYRKSKEELYALADGLEKNYGCKISAEFIREAADAYEKRGRLRREDD